MGNHSLNLVGPCVCFFTRGAFVYLDPSLASWINLHSACVRVSAMMSELRELRHEAHEDTREKRSGDGQQLVSLHFRRAFDSHRFRTRTPYLSHRLEQTEPPLVFILSDATSLDSLGSLPFARIPPLELHFRLSHSICPNLSSISDILRSIVTVARIRVDD